MKERDRGAIHCLGAAGYAEDRENVSGKGAALLASIVDGPLSGFPIERLAFLIEKALLLDDAARRRSLKGAAGQKAAADERRRLWEQTARQLMEGRCCSFTSYRQLAAAVVRRAGLMESTETVRKHLAGIRILDP